MPLISKSDHSGFLYKLVTGIAQSQEKHHSYLSLFGGMLEGAFLDFSIQSSAPLLSVGSIVAHAEHEMGSCSPTLSCLRVNEEGGLVQTHTREFRSPNDVKKFCQHVQEQLNQFYREKFSIIA